MIETLGTVTLWLIALGLLAWSAIALLVNRPEAGIDVGWMRRGRRAGGIVGAAGLALLVLLLSGCSTPTVTKVETVEVKVPVAVQPIRPDQVPAVPPPLPKRPPDARDALDVALAKVCEFVAYAVRADPLLRISAGGRPVELPRYPECEGN